jgi:hypothetical protein
MKGNAHAEPRKTQPPPTVAIPPRPKQARSHSWDTTPKMLKMKGYPTMLMKTKENRSDILTNPYDAYENKRLIFRSLRCL